MSSTPDRNVLTVNSGFLYEEVTEGQVGMELSAADRARFETIPSSVLTEALDEVFSDTSHPIHAALDALVASAVDRLGQRGLLAGPDEPEDVTPAA